MTQRKKVLELIHKRVGWKLADEDLHRERRPRKREKGKDRWRGGGEGEEEIEQKTQLYFTVLLCPPLKQLLALSFVPLLTSPSATLAPGPIPNSHHNSCAFHTWDSGFLIRGFFLC